MAANKKAKILPKKVAIQVRAVRVGNTTGPGRSLVADKTIAGDEIKLTEPGKQKLHPVGHRILIRDWVFTRKTAGGIELPDEILDAKEHLNFIGQVMELGPNCYRKGMSAVPSDEPWCKQNDWVVFAKYAGQRAKTVSTGEQFRFVNDNDILGIAESPEDLLVYL